MPTGGGGGGGGGGGLTSVTHDASLTGLGTAGTPLGLLAVSTQPRLTGAGISTSKLDIAGWPLTAWLSEGTGANVVSTLNQTTIIGITIPYALTFSHISFYLTNNDVGGTLYDIGLYSAAGNLIADIGAQVYTTINLNVIPTVQGAQTIPPGLYALAHTMNNAGFTAVYFGTNNVPAWVFNSAYAATVGGQLPATIPAISLAPTLGNIPSLMLS